MEEEISEENIEIALWLQSMSLKIVLNEIEGGGMIPSELRDFYRVARYSRVFEIFLGEKKIEPSA